MTTLWRLLALLVISSASQSLGINQASQCGGLHQHYNGIISAVRTAVDVSTVYEQTDEIPAVKLSVDKAMRIVQAGIEDAVVAASAIERIATLAAASREEVKAEGRRFQQLAECVDLCLTGLPTADVARYCWGMTALGVSDPDKYGRVLSEYSARLASKDRSLTAAELAAMIWTAGCVRDVSGSSNHAFVREAAQVLCDKLYFGVAGNMVAAGAKENAFTALLSPRLALRTVWSLAVHDVYIQPLISKCLEIGCGDSNSGHISTSTASTLLWSLAKLQHMDARIIAQLLEVISQGEDQPATDGNPTPRVQFLSTLCALQQLVKSSGRQAGGKCDAAATTVETSILESAVAIFAKCTALGFAQDTAHSACAALSLLSEMSPAQWERAAVAAESLDVCLDHCIQHLRSANESSETGRFREVAALVAKLSASSTDNGGTSTTASCEKVRWSRQWYRLLGACAVRGVAGSDKRAVADSHVILSNVYYALARSELCYRPLTTAVSSAVGEPRTAEATEIAAAPMAFSYEEEEGLVRNSDRLLDLVRAAAGVKAGAPASPPPQMHPVGANSGGAVHASGAAIAHKPAEKWIPPQRRAAMEGGYTLFSLEEEEGVVSNAERLAALVRSAAADPPVPPAPLDTTTHQEPGADRGPPAEASEMDIRSMIDTAVSIAEELQARIAETGRAGEAGVCDAEIVARGEANLRDLRELLNRPTDTARTTGGEHPCPTVEASAHFALGLLEEALLVYRQSRSAALVEASPDKEDVVKRRRLLTRFFRAFALA